MQIRTRLSLYFTLISAVLLLVVLLAIGVLYTNHTRNDFEQALKERAIVTAQVYLEADEISDSSLQHFKEEYLNTLPDEIIRMYDSTNHPAFINDSGFHFNSDTINLIRQKKFMSYKAREREVVGIRYDDNQGSFVIMVSAVNKPAKERAKVLLQGTLVIYLLELLLLFVVGRWFSKQALEPVQKINEQMHHISATDLHLRVDEGNGKDEISELATNFNSLLHRLETAFDVQRTFVSNASHELRTPLTTMIGEIEVTTSKQRTADEYKEVLLSVLGEAEKLNGVIDGLLQLAGAENTFGLQAVEPVRVDELLWELQAQFSKLNPPHVLNIHLLSMPEDDSKLCVTANRHLLLLALNNIVKNAFKFSHIAPVDCLLASTPHGLQINIQDKGIGIKEEELANIFQPFYRGQKAKEFDGQGLGLFMAKKIIDLYKGIIEVKTTPGNGTAINILFPNKTGF
jgi:signal transduction histidine kinase